MGILIPQTLVIWASPSHITVRITEDAHITRVLGMGLPQKRGDAHITVTPVTTTGRSFPTICHGVSEDDSRNLNPYQNVCLRSVLGD